jgi:hypothetical protein
VCVCVLLLLQAIVPGSRKLGVHKGEPFYRRNDVHDLHTAERWRREGREVKEEVRVDSAGEGGGLSQVSTPSPVCAVEA